MTLLVIMPVMYLSAQQSAVDEDIMFVDGVLYDGLAHRDAGATNTSFTIDGTKGFKDSTGVIINQKLVGEAAPGDSDYEHGRWTRFIVQFTTAGLDSFDVDRDQFYDLEEFMIRDVPTVLSLIGSGHIEITSGGIFELFPIKKSN